MMEKLLKLKKYMKDWKVITACVAVVALVGGIAIYVSANSNIKFVFEMAGSEGKNYIEFGTNQNERHINILDFTGNVDGIKAINPSPTYEDYIDYVKWEINQKKGSDISKNIIQFTDAKDTENSVLYTQKLKDLFNNWDAALCVDKQYVEEARFSKVNPGKAVISATYYTPEFQNGSRVNYEYSQSISVYVPLSLTVSADSVNFSRTTPYAMGTSFTFSTNAGQNNPAVFSYSNSDNITQV